VETVILFSGGDILLRPGSSEAQAAGALLDYRTPGVAGLWIPFGSVSTGLRRTDTAMREWLGLVTYWLTGRSSALFPGP
jgi:hypothetical protein